MSSNPITLARHKLRKTRWQSWISPLLLLVCAWALLRLVTSSDPFFIKSFSPAIRGEMPEVRFAASRTLIGTICLSVLLNVFLLQTLRQWARYYLNRKLVLSYLLFAIVPLLTNLFIFTAGITTWLGISNTFIVEKAIERQVTELERFTGTLVRALSQSSLDHESTRQAINKARMDHRANFSFLETAAMPIEVYLLLPKYPGSPENLIPLYRSGSSNNEDNGDAEDLDGMIRGDSKEFEMILPTWMQRTQWTDIVNKGGRLSVRHFSFSPDNFGTLMVVTAIPIDSRFFGILKDFQTMRITLAGMDGSTISTRPTPPPWYLRLPLRPLASSRDVLALDWDSGLYQEYGRMVFEIEPAEIQRILDHSNTLNIFYGEEQKTALRFIIITTALLGVGVLIAVIFGIYLISYITRSLNIIAEGHEQIKSGYLNFRLPYIGKDQLGSMGRSFNSMAGSIESLMSQVAEKEKYQEELRIARDIQMSLLPDLTTLPWCTNVSAVCIPAREVGGDYYEVLQAGNGKIGIFIADVSGKGTSAAFYMAELKGILIALRHLWHSPQELLLRMNEILKPALAPNVFISAAYLLLDPEMAIGTLVRAGHCPSYLVHEHGEVRELMPPGIALGITNNLVFGKIIEAVDFPMGPQDKVILYTDGLDEMTHQHTMYGTEKLKLVLRNNSTLSSDDLKAAILKDVLDFLSSEEQNDDLTLVVAGLPEKIESHEKKKPGMVVSTH